ncbi:hypothetical protein EVAR_102437_1 [Eumeta japonica]|uniref:Uncharacterized protein n=1 Tax=Eumeta variegata TaxID=151549 RepID=A0A4C1Z1M3_EUMVA|nr:hypothetical protein EVAR_102437_1 [Eumeta japonica]
MKKIALGLAAVAASAVGASPALVARARTSSGRFDRRHYRAPPPACREGSSRVGTVIYQILFGRETTRHVHANKASTGERRAAGGAPIARELSTGKGG